MKIKIFLPFLLTALFFSACSEDFFETTVPVDIPEHTPALAITSEMIAGDTIIAAYVSSSVNILEDIPYEPIKDATVELFKDGQAFATIPYFEEFETKFYILELDEPFPFDMSEYELRVSAPGFEPVTAKQTMPPAVEIITAEFDPQGAINPEGDRVDEFSVEFQDPAGVENYYELVVRQMEGEFGGTVYLENLDPLGEEYDGRIYLKDSTFDGKKYTWRVGGYTFFGGPSADRSLGVELHAITRDQYLFARSASLSEEADDNPFAEPVIVHGNVEGGNGIFSLGTKDVEIIEL